MNDTPLETPLTALKYLWDVAVAPHPATCTGAPPSAPPRPAGGGGVTRPPTAGAAPGETTAGVGDGPASVRGFETTGALGLRVTMDFLACARRSFRAPCFCLASPTVIRCPSSVSMIVASESVRNCCS